MILLRLSYGDHYPLQGIGKSFPFHLFRSALTLAASNLYNSKRSAELSVSVPTHLTSHLATTVIDPELLRRQSVSFSCH